MFQGVVLLLAAVEAEEELLQGAENGRYKVVAKAEPYKNLPVRICLCVCLSDSVSISFSLSRGVRQI